MDDNYLLFNLAKPEQARWMAILLAELQNYGVKFTLTKDANYAYIYIK